ncbi:MAG: hypothetical protein Aurels2KO_46190 [Aureliella sp.]
MKILANQYLMACENEAHSRASRWQKKRAATVYLAVLGTSVIVAMLSLTAIHSARMSLNSVQNNGHDSQARAAATAAIEIALATINADDDWRSNLSSGTVYPEGGQMLGDARISWAVIDVEDGSLSNAQTGRTVVHGTGEIDETVYTYQVELLQSGGPLACLESALHCDDPILVGTTVELRTDQRISTNQDVYGLFPSSIRGDVEASGSLLIGGSGARMSGVATREMPGNDVFDYYKAMGTQIDAADIRNGVELHVEDILLTTNNNPYGDANPEGIYWIDCEGSRIRIRDCRLACTLVLFNTGSGAELGAAVHIEPPRRNMPSLLVEGNLFVLQSLTSEIGENGQVNFNPPSHPLGGLSDTDTTDYFPSMVHGLVYVSGRLDLFVDFMISTFTGPVVCERIAANSKANFYYTPYAFNNPPPGFCRGDEVQIMPGSWQRVTAGQAVSGLGGSGTPSQSAAEQPEGDQPAGGSESEQLSEPTSEKNASQSTQGGFFSRLLQLW